MERCICLALVSKDRQWLKGVNEVTKLTAYRAALVALMDDFCSSLNPIFLEKNLILSLNLI